MIVAMSKKILLYVAEEAETVQLIFNIICRMQRREKCGNLRYILLTCFIKQKYNKLGKTIENSRQQKYSD